MTPTDHNQAEYVRGIQAGRRIERQHQVGGGAARDATLIAIGAFAGALIRGLITHL
jgi:hypothetical protein